MTCGKLDIVCQLEVINKFNIEVSFQNLEKYSYFLFLFYKLCFFWHICPFHGLFCIPSYLSYGPLLKRGTQEETMIVKTE